MLKDKYRVNRGSDNGFHPAHREEGADANPMSEILERLEHKYHFRAEEPGLYHPTEKGTVKIRNTGAVEIFADQDTGMRVDPDTQTINAFANHYKANLHHMTEWLTGNSTSYIKGNLKIKTTGTTDIYSGKDIRIEGKKGLQIYIDKDEKVIIGGNSSVEIKGNVDLKVHGNVNAKVYQHATIEVLRDLKVRAGGNISMVAGGHVHIDGTKLFIGMDVRK